MKTNRDISLIKLNKDQILVIGCDSLGGIGDKPEDKIKVANKVVGQLTARVALMEVLASGAEPIQVINNLSVELEPTGQEIIAGIGEELAKLGLDNLLTGSSEENISTVQTGIGVTVVGKAFKNQLRVASSQLGDLIVALGLPKVGSEVPKSVSEIADLDLIMKLLPLDYIHEILPVGSQGILYEANLLANSNNLESNVEDADLDLNKSAGPATVILVTVAEEDLTRLKKMIDRPLNVIGKLK